MLPFTFSLRECSSVLLSVVEGWWRRGLTRHVPLFAMYVAQKSHNNDDGAWEMCTNPHLHFQIRHLAPGTLTYECLQKRMCSFYRVSSPPFLPSSLSFAFFPACLSPPTIV